MPTEKPIIWAAAIAVLAGGAALYYYFHTHESEPAAPPAQQLKLPPPPPEPKPAIANPVPSTPAPAAQPLPALNDSDAPVHDALVALPGAAALEKFLVPQNLVRHIVVTIDNLPRKKVAVEVRPLKPTAGQFATRGDADSLTLNTQNYQRYAPFIELVKSTDTHQLVAAYFHFYPLFQQAYEDLGYPGQYFNDRVVQVIDDLLATPDVPGPVQLVQPNVMFLYADAKLEARSAGEKTLIRMGPDNESLIKQKLQQIRAEIAAKKK